MSRKYRYRLQVTIFSSVFFFFLFVLAHHHSPQKMGELNRHIFHHTMA